MTNSESSSNIQTKVCSDFENITPFNEVFLLEINKGSLLRHKIKYTFYLKKRDNGTIYLESLLIYKWNNKKIKWMSRTDDYFPIILPPNIEYPHKISKENLRLMEGSDHYVIDGVKDYLVIGLIKQLFMEKSK